MPNGYAERRKKPTGLNFGDILHLIEIAVLFISIGAGYQKFTQNQEEVQQHTKQLDRIEHYLSSRDSKYWEIVRDN